MGNKNYPVIDIKETGHNIKTLMISQGYSVKDVQNYLGLGTPQGIYHWFEGKSLPSLDNLYALSELFTVPMDTLISGNRKASFISIRYDIPNIIYFYYAMILMLQFGRS